MGKKPTNQDKYYAILLMDGDKMGKLVNGETIASTWKTIMHPDIVKRLDDPSFDEKYYTNWQRIFSENTTISIYYSNTCFPLIVAESSIVKF